jgi:hypothetical protein
MVGRPFLSRSGSTTDWTEITELREASYREIAPARLVRMLDASLTKPLV